MICNTYFLNFLSLQKTVVDRQILCDACLLFYVHREANLEGVYLVLISVDLVKLSDCQDLPIDLEPYVKKLIGSRRRITLVNSILQNAQVNFSLSCQLTD